MFSTCVAGAFGDLFSWNWNYGEFELPCGCYAKATSALNHSLIQDSGF